MANTKNSNSSGFSKFINLFGSIVIAAMLIIVGINFYRDARIFEKPLLTKADGAASKSAGSDGFKTIQYKKPASDSSSKSKSKPKPKPDTKAPAATQPASTDSSSTAGTNTGAIPPSDP